MLVKNMRNHTILHMNHMFIKNMETMAEKTKIINIKRTVTTHLAIINKKYSTKYKINTYFPECNNALFLNNH